MDRVFDFIIVGAGSAGCVLAERLSANGRHSVLVLEAGGSDRRFFIQMPLGYGKTFYDPSVNWMYAAEADPGLNGQRDYWPRGKVLGGSSSINAMVYIRGAREDYENWEAAGNKGWGWDEVLRCYRAMEDTEAGANEFRGVDGPLPVRCGSKDFHPLYLKFVLASNRAGLPLNEDFNGATQEGVGAYQYTTRNGQRMSAARAFLRPAMKRRNVRVVTHAQVTKVLFEGRRTAGVEYLHRGVRKTAMTGREVILAGGAINSAQLLQHSGIGPAKVLQAHGIEVRRENANVGAHLQDHVGLNYTYRMKVPTLNDELRPWWGKLRVGLRYVLSRGGPLSLSVNQGGGFFRSSPAHTRPNMQLYMQAFSTLIPKVGERPLLSPDPFSGFSLGLSNCRPSSRGFIEIQSADPLQHPRIVANAYSTDEDVAEMLDAVKFLRKIAAQEPLAEVIAEELRPGPACVSDDELIADIRQRSGTVYHPSCTCRMGPDAADSVVDPRLRVHGIQNLRVCDASVFPSLIAGNSNGPAMMVGWHGAEIILNDQI
ncbi:MAG TPA: GMC family oxidoreductase N-terminal domain-containing protein [Aestuariivirga sp.]|nr:GMC family oxidoreductase N-terminal domain-containing protein [Aestuariivirga sp.]